MCVKRDTEGVSRVKFVHNTILWEYKTMNKFNISLPDALSVGLDMEDAILRREHGVFA